MNGHEGEKLNFGKGFGRRNKEGERLLETVRSCSRQDNSFSTKKREHLLTYRIDYMRVRRNDPERVKVILGESVAPQHKMLCVKLKIKGERVKRSPS